MTGLAWLALGLALLLAGAPARVPIRVVRLAGAGRLAARPRRRRHAGRRAARFPSRSPSANRALAVAGYGAVLAGAVALRVAPLGVAADAVGWAGWRLSRAMAIRRKAVRRRAELRAALSVLIGELEAGSQPAAALTAAADATGSHAAVLIAAAGAARAAGDAGAVLLTDPDTAALGHAWRLGESTGAAMSGVLGRVAGDLAARDAQHRAVAVALSGPRSSAVVLAGLPVVGLVLGIAMGARPDRFLLGSPAGRWVGVTGVLLDVLGVLWLAAILRKAELG